MVRIYDASETDWHGNGLCIAADFSAIEARVPVYLTGEQWVLNVFAANGDIYCEEGCWAEGLRGHSRFPHLL